MVDLKETVSRRTRAKAKYNSKAYEQIHLMVKKGEKEIIRQRAADKGESVNGYIRRLIFEDMDNEE